MRGKTVLILISIAIAVQGFLVALQFRQLNSDRNAGRTQTCLGISKLDNTLIKLVRQSESSLPTFAYYKEHPADLVTVLAQDEATITALTPPKYC